MAVHERGAHGAWFDPGERYEAFSTSGSGANTDAGSMRVVSEETSFERLYQAHFPFVWRNVLRLGADRSVADDLVQEVFLVVHRRLKDFDGRSKMTTWLFGIVRRVLSDYRRTLQRKPTNPTPIAELDRYPHPKESARFEQLEAHQLVSVLLDTLDDDQREVLILAELEGMTMAEIALATGTNPNTVPARLRAARKALEEALMRHEGRSP